MSTMNLATAYRAIRAGAGLLDGSTRVRLRVTGTERAKFLQGILTNDVNALESGRGVYAAVLTAKGKMQADLTLYAPADWWWVDAEPEVAGTLTLLLTRYTIGTNAVVSDLSATHSLFGIYGPDAARVLAAVFTQPAVPTDDLEVRETDWNGHRAIIAESGYPGVPGYKLLLPAGAAAAARLALTTAGATEVDPSALDIVRIECGIPRFGPDMSEENFPPEARIESRAVSYTKGCYMGQETIARIKTYGHVNRLLVGLLPDTDRPVPADTRIVSVGDQAKEIGYVTSSVMSPGLGRVIALGYVHRTSEAPGTPVALKTDRAIPAIVTALPFVPRP